MARAGLDNFQRASYLYQLSWAALRARPDRPAASHHYSHQLAEFCQKAVLRMERQMKRSVCKACHTLLVPGTTCTVRTRRRPQRCQVWLCRACGQCRRFPCPRPARPPAAGQQQQDTDGQVASGVQQVQLPAAGQQQQDTDGQAASGVQQVQLPAAGQQQQDTDGHASASCERTAR